MELHFLGTGSAFPTPNRAASCIVLRSAKDCFMFDCGEGSQTQLMKSSLKVSRISKVFITHLHGDHVFGLSGFLATFHQAEAPERIIEIFGPIGLRRYVRESLKLTRSDLGCRYVVHELVPLECQYPTDWKEWTVDHEADSNLHPKELPGQTIAADERAVWHLFEDDNFLIQAGWLKHRIPSFGYCVLEKYTSNNLNVDFLKSHGVYPGRLYGQLKKGLSITTPDGTTLSPEQCIIKQDGTKVVILGDSCDSSAMKSLADKADVLVHEATLENALEEACIEKGHSTPAMAGRFAKESNITMLILSHFSQRYKLDTLTTENATNDDAVDVKENFDISTDKLVAEAKIAFGSDSVVAAKDFFIWIVTKMR